MILAMAEELITFATINALDDFSKEAHMVLIERKRHRRVLGWLIDPVKIARVLGTRDLRGGGDGNS